jgi:hypothetical protein
MKNKFESVDSDNRVQGKKCFPLPDAETPPTHTPLVLLQSSWRKIKRPSRETIVRMCEGAYWTVLSRNTDQRKPKLPTRQATV